MIGSTIPPKLSLLQCTGRGYATLLGVPSSITPRMEKIIFKGSQATSGEARHRTTGKRLDSFQTLGSPQWRGSQSRTRRPYSQSHQLNPTTHWMGAIIKGRFANEWNTHHQTQPGTGQKNSSWTAEIINFIFMQWWKLWELRNQDRHGWDLATQQQARAQQADCELHLLYTDYEGRTPQHLRWIFDTPLKCDDSGRHQLYGNG